MMLFRHHHRSSSSLIVAVLATVFLFVIHVDCAFLPVNNNDLTKPKTNVIIHNRRINNNTVKSNTSPLFPNNENKVNNNNNPLIVERAGAASTSSEGGGDATIPNEVFNLIKNIVGAGILGLPAGVAAFGNTPTAVIPAIMIITIIGIISAYCFSLIGRVCAMTGATSYRDAWDKTIGTQTSIIPAISSTLTCTFANLAYSMILADTFQKLFISAGISSITRNMSLGLITILGLIPLCLLKNLSSLAPFSLLGIIGMGYTGIGMLIRYVDGTYKVPDGKFLADITEKSMLPTFGTDKGFMSAFTSPSSFILISMLSSAFLAHFNAAQFYNELRNNTIPRFNIVVTSSFLVSIIFFAFITTIGYLTFGTGSSGLILNNYSTKDTIMSISRITVAISILFSYPLVFAGTREGFLDLMKIKSKDRTDGTVNKITLGLLSVITALAIKVKDLSLILSLLGATLGNCLIYIFPSLMFRSAITNKYKNESSPSLRMKLEVKFAMLCGIIGLIMGGIGVKMALQ